MKYDIKTLTLDEKLRLLTGRNSWQLDTANGKLPEVFLSDGPHGLRMHDIQTNATKKATAMPSLSLLSCTWDTELAYLDGQTIANDCIEHGADILLAPGVNMKRTPLCGRNFEYFSEDPFIAGTLAKAYIEGVQSKGVGTSLKHFCLNNREYDRFFQTSEVDERTMHEIYLPAFEIALEAKPWTVMCAYNPINGVWASENKKVLNGILREELGFDGLIMSDWRAVHQSARAAKATLDLEMPYREEAFGELKEAYESGFLTEEEIDARVEKILALMEKVATAEKKIELTKQQRHENAVKIVKEGIVLLKNEDGILPLKGGKILFSGPFGACNAYGGEGSSKVQTDSQPRHLKEEVAERLQGAETFIPTGWNVNAGLGAWKIKDAFKCAYGADTVVISVGTGSLTEGEGWDRTTLRLTPPQEDLILGTAKVNKNVVVVLHAGSAVDMTPWIDKVKAVVLSGFSGEGGQEAIADILTGRACPCGKLTETYPLCLEDTPAGEDRGNGFAERYAEGIFMGYRYYDYMQKEVLFPFGYGLSYAQFVYSNLKIEKKGETDYEVSYDIENVSDVNGKEISQVYVRDVFSMVLRPVKELKGFAKTALKAGEKKRVCVKLNARSFAYYNTALDRWYVENGDFEILVGASSRDIRLMGKVNIALPFETQYSRD